MSRRSEAIYFGAYWGNRSEPATDCAERLVTCLESLSRLATILGEWRPKARTAKAARAMTLPTTVDDFAELLVAGQNRRDFDRSVVPELGYRWSAWNGRNALACSLGLTCGASASQSGVLNTFNMSVPALDEPGAEEIYEAGEAIIATIVESWTADWAVATSYALMNEQATNDDERPPVGWLTWVGPLRKGVELGVPCAGGRLVAASPAWEETDSAHVAQITKQLHAANALAPIT